MLDLSGYDLVITSDSGPMKGVVTDLNATHICYCHSPMRYLWDGHSAYLRGMSPLMRTIFGLASHYVRNWDYLGGAKSGSLHREFQLCRSADSQVLPARQHDHSSADQYFTKLLGR